jgi:hypothetical protein
MKHDPLDPPAIARPAQDIGDLIFADRINTIMSEARNLGIRTIKEAVECGRMLIQAKAEIDRHNETVKRRKDRIEWQKVVEKYGFSRTTAWRLMKKTVAHDSAFHLKHELDAIYDDGYDPAADEGKKPCRDCRHRGKKFNKDCAACRALNRPAPKPKDDGPPRDEDGNPIPEHLIEIFNEGQILRELTGYLLNANKALNGLAERPGLSAVRFDELERRLKTLRAYALKYRPGYVHLDCDSRGCDGCNNRGWRTVMEVLDERAAEANRKKRERAKVWHTRQDKNAKGRVSNDPIPD